MDARIEIRNGAKSRAFFSTQEMKTRLSKARQLMEQHHLDALLLSGVGHISYFSGLVVDSREKAPTVLLILPQRSVLIAPLSVGGHSYRNSFCESWLYADFGHFLQHVQHYLSGAKRIGVASMSFSAGLLRRLATVLPSLKKALCVEVPLCALRKIKSEEEKLLYSRAEQIAKRGFEIGVSLLKEGISELDLALKIREALIFEAAYFFPQMDVSQSYSRVQSSLNTDSVIAPPSTRLLQQGDLVNLTVCPVIGHYDYPVSCSVVVGTSGEVDSAYTTSLKSVYQTFLDCVQVNIPISLLRADMKRYLEYRLKDVRNYDISIGCLDAVSGEEALGEEMRIQANTIVVFSVQLSKLSYDHYLNVYRLTHPVWVEGPR
ncbi:aminopeptidase P family N-terminal domain-containing protein [Celerinatantimonas sp. YJH-8]|uniref:aminopeptidase P family N-terminal domain-containing protein n=1 Tax=Celerinatantimonas sp. YJH-8 TaxID=3228714 RepID=UPI0038C0C666